MTPHRQRLWLNILEDLGPPEGHTLPTWLLALYALLFPLQAARLILDRATGHNILNLTWRIHGLTFSDHLFAQLALSEGSWYRFTTTNGVITIERTPAPTP